MTSMISPDHPWTEEAIPSSENNTSLILLPETNTEGDKSLCFTGLKQRLSVMVELCYDFNFNKMGKHPAGSFHWAMGFLSN